MDAIGDAVAVGLASTLGNSHALAKLCRLLKSSGVLSDDDFGEIKYLALRQFDEILGTSIPESRSSSLAEARSLAEDAWDGFSE